MSMIRSLPRSNRARRYGFSFTPLADAMFQLLVFFMLTSSLAPYSLMTLTPGGTGSVAAEAPTSQVDLPIDTAENVAVWSIGRGSLRADGESVAMDDVATLVPPLQEAGIGRVVLLTGRSATVQDVASVLEALTLARIPTVQIVAGSTQ